MRGRKEGTFFPDILCLLMHRQVNYYTAVISIHTSGKDGQQSSAVFPTVWAYLWSEELGHHIVRGFTRKHHAAVERKGRKKVERKQSSPNLNFIYYCAYFPLNIPKPSHHNIGNQILKVFGCLNASTGAEEALKMLMNLKASDFTNFSSAKNNLHRQFWNPIRYTDVHQSILQSPEAWNIQPHPCTPLNDLCPDSPLCLWKTSFLCTDMLSRKKLLKSRAAWTFLIKKLTKSTCRKLHFNRMYRRYPLFSQKENSQTKGEKKTNLIKFQIHTEKGRLEEQASLLL